MSVRNVSRRSLIRGAGTIALVPAPFGAAAQAATRSSDIQVVGLRTDYLEAPLGVETRQPLLSWRLQSDRRGKGQSAYQVEVASDRRALDAGSADLWDSGRVASSESVAVKYAGRSLATRQQCFWRVTVWDDAGKVTHSDIASWEMGLLHPEDWGDGRWLAAESPEFQKDWDAGFRWIRGPAPQGGQKTPFRLVFTVPEAAEATVMLATYADMECWMDGAALPIGPPIGNGPKPAQVISLSLSAGPHVLAVAVGALPGTLGPVLGVEGAELAAFVKLRLADGGVMRLGQDGWKTSLDAPEGWRAWDFDDSHWPPPSRVTEARSHPWPPQPAICLRRGFVTRGKVERARIYVAARGAYELHLNGRPIDDAVLSPGSTDFRKASRYRVIDVTNQVQAGSNVVGAIVGDGWYASYAVYAGRYPWGDTPRGLLLRLELTYADGSMQVIAPDDAWRGAPSPILSSEIYDGEHYDARNEQPGWSSFAFDDAAWWPVTTTAGPSAPMAAQVGPPIRRHQRLPALAITQPRPGTYVVDFGQNFAGWCRLRAKGPHGTRIELQFAELLGTDGLVNRATLRLAQATDSYVMRGDGAEEVYEPRFTYHGFRYVQVSGFPGELGPENLEGVVAHSDLPASGELLVQSPQINRLRRTILWTQRSNFMGIPTDCPQRSERLGWLGDANMFWDTAAFNMDVAAFSRSFMAEVRAAQSANGSFPEFAPIVRRLPAGLGNKDAKINPALPPSSTPGWATGGVKIPWTAWQHYGDTTIIDDNWSAMDRFCAAILADNADHVWRNGRGFDLGDWLALDTDNDDPGKPTTPKDLVATALWADTAQCMAQMADATGRGQDASRYRALRQVIGDRFKAEFVGGDGAVGDGSQAGYILSLFHDLVPAPLRAAAAKNLTDDIRRRGVVLSTGVLGTGHSLDVLADTGHADLAYSLLLRKAYPSWGYMAEQGATTLWEAWDSDKRPRSSSRNHYALGSVGGFLFRRVAGIAPLEPGFRRLEISPVTDPRVKRGGGRYDSVRGPISIDWRQQGDGRFSVQLDIPANVSARLLLPSQFGHDVREGGKDVKRAANVRYVGMADTRHVLEVGSGRYSFEVG